MAMLAGKVTLYRYLIFPAKRLNLQIGTGLGKHNIG